MDLFGDNTLTVRGSTYKLLQFHFHTPSEEQINYRNFAMVAHLVHKNAQGQLAVVAVLLDPGVANALINKVWTYIPLDTSDQVRLPAGIIDMNELPPKDQRYYQFMGSLTTPPCTEGAADGAQTTHHREPGTNQALYPAVPAQRAPDAAGQRAGGAECAVKPGRCGHEIVVKHGFAQVGRAHAAI